MMKKPDGGQGHALSGPENQTGENASKACRECGGLASHRIGCPWITPTEKSKGFALPGMETDQRQGRIFHETRNRCAECGPHQSTHEPGTLPFYDHRTFRHNGVTLVYPRGDLHYPAPVAVITGEPQILEKGEQVVTEEDLAKIRNRVAVDTMQSVEPCAYCMEVGRHKFACREHPLAKIGDKRKHTSNFGEQVRALKVYRYLETHNKELLAQILREAE